VGKKSRGKSAPVIAEHKSSENEGLLHFVHQLTESGQYQEALRAALALVERDSRNPRAHVAIGSLLMQLQQPHFAAGHLELAIQLSGQADPELFEALVMTYGMAGLATHALVAARMGMRFSRTPEQQAKFQKIVGAGEEFLTQAVRGRDIPLANAEESMLAIERATRAMLVDDPEAARKQAEEATEKTPQWPLPWSNLATLLFTLDHVPEALAACEQGLEAVGADEAQLLSTLVRLQAITGREADAAGTLARLATVGTADPTAAFNVAKGFAIMGDDARVHELLSTLAVDGGKQLAAVRFMLGVAGANLGKDEEARGVWRGLAREGMQGARQFVEMLARNEVPPTPDGRYPYFSAYELLPGPVLKQLAASAHEDPEAASTGEASKRFPRLTYTLCQMLFEADTSPRMAMSLLASMPDAGVVAALDRYAASRLGDDYDRLYAHLLMRAAGVVDPERPAIVWLKGERHEFALPKLGRHARGQDYADQIRVLREEATQAQRDGSSAQAELCLYCLLAYDRENAWATDQLAQLEASGPKSE
jgi:tetratricopeptide (TPR) repeat protein